MIVRDEQELLPQCLESIQTLCDQLVIIDTGSEDSTVSIAESFGAEVYHSPWTNNFSHHRNESIAKASGDFLIILDADEKLVIDPKLTKKDIHEWFEKTPEDVNAIAVMVQDIQDGKMMMCCNSARIFRKGKIHYEGVVHNQPIFTGPCGLCHFMYLEHYGYGLSEDKMEVKFIRTSELLLDRYEKDKEDYQVGFYLCQLYG
jgi:transposase-like protein